jgi:hypothetical protein
MVMSPARLGLENDKPIFSSERAPPQEQTHNCLTVIKICSLAPDGCFTPRQACRLTVGRNATLTLISRDEVTGSWRKLHNEELHNLYSSPSIIRMIKSRRMGWAWHVARMVEKRNAYRILVGKPEGKRPRRRWVDNIKMYLRETGWDGTDWIDLAQDRGPLEGSCEHGNELSVSIKCWVVLEWLHN